jgi:hypothetical protein
MAENQDAHGVILPSVRRIVHRRFRTWAINSLCASKPSKMPNG